MPKKVNQIIIGIFLVIIFIQFGKSAILTVYSTIYALFLIMSILFFYRGKWENIVLLFIIMYPMQDVLPSKSLIIPGMGIVEILLIMLILKYFMRYKSIDLDFNRIQISAILLSFFFIVIYTGTFYIKHFYFFGLDGYSDSKLLVRLFKLLLLFISIFLIISKSKEPLIFSKIQNGLLIGFIVYGLSIIFSNFLIDIGLNISSEFQYERGKVTSGLLRDRAVGLMQGDSGLLAHYLCVGLGFFLALIEGSRNKRFIYLFGIMSVVVGLITTASRTGIIVAGIIIIVFIFKNIRTNNKFIKISIIIPIFVGYYYFGSYSMERIRGLSDEINAPEYQYAGRKYFQMFYFYEILDNPYYLLFGYLKPSKLYTDYHRLRTPHNQYLGMVIWGGLSYLIIFLGLLYKIYKCNNIKYNSSQSFSILYPFIGFTFPYLFNPNEYILYFPLILSISTGVMAKYSNFFEPGKKQYFNAI